MAGDGYVRGRDQLAGVMEETSRVGSPRPAKTAADRVPKLRKDPNAPVQERRTIERERPIEPPPTAGRKVFGVDFGD